MSHVRVWKFRPPKGREPDFAETYGSGGVWTKLFARAPGYRGTELLRPEKAGGWWLTIDRWNAKSDFEAFQREFGDEYRALDAKLESLSGEEEFVGAFEEPG